MTAEPRRKSCRAAIERRRHNGDVPRPSLLALALILHLPACKPAGAVTSGWTPSPQAEPAAAPQPGQPVSDPATLAQMHALLGATEILRDRAARGETESLQAEARALVASLQPQDDAPATWQCALDLVRAEATVIAEGGDDVAAANALAQIAHICGDCHESTGAQQAVASTVRRGPAPDVGETEADAMAVHRWATGQMWDSLVIPDGDRWI